MNHILPKLFFVTISIAAANTALAESPVLNMGLAGIEKSDLTSITQRASERSFEVKRAADIQLRDDLAGEGSRPSDIRAYGVIGNTYEINDPDTAAWGSAMIHGYMRTHPLSKEDIEKQVYSASIRMPRTKEAHSYKVDMTATLKEDKYIEAGKDLGGRRLLAPKGTKINPFKYIGFPYTLWFLDEQDDAYLDEAMNDDLSLIVIVHGNMKAISDKHPGITMSKATKEVLYRMAIRSVPSKAYKCHSEDMLCVEQLKAAPND